MWYVWLYFVLFGFYTLMPKHIVHEATTHTVRRVIDTHEFLYTCDNVNGTMREEWRVDGVIAPFDTYEAKLLEAEMAERRAEISAERATCQRESDRIHRIRRAADHKLVDLEIEQIRALQAKIKDFDIELYAQWGDTSIMSRAEYDRIMQHVIPDIMEQVAMREVDYEALVALHDELEGYARTLEDLIDHTIDFVIQTCRDTQVLKRLLMMGD